MFARSAHEMTEDATARKGLEERQSGSLHRCVHLPPPTRIFRVHLFIFCAYNFILTPFCNGAFHVSCAQQVFLAVIAVAVFVRTEVAVHSAVVTDTAVVVVVVGIYYLPLLEGYYKPDFSSINTSPCGKHTDNEGIVCHSSMLSPTPKRHHIPNFTFSTLANTIRTPKSSQRMARPWFSLCMHSFLHPAMQRALCL